MTTKTRTFNARVVGVTFCDDYPGTLHRLEAAALTQFNGLPHAKDAEPLPARLVREPDNPHDPNAIAVHQPSAGMIGHLPRDLAARLAPRFGNGTAYAAGIHSVVVHPDHPERPGIDLIIEEVRPA